MCFSGSLLVIFQIGILFELFLDYIMSCSLSLRLSTLLLFLWHWEWNAEPSYMPGLLVSFRQLGINQRHLGRGKVSWGTVCIRWASGPVSRVVLDCYLMEEGPGQAISSHGLYKKGNWMGAWNKISEQYSWVVSASGPASRSYLEFRP